MARGIDVWRQIVKDWLKSEAIDRSQAWLARKAHCSESYLSLCLGGRVDPTDGFLYGLEAAMDIPRGTLVDAKAEKKATEGDWERVVTPGAPSPDESHHD